MAPSGEARGGCFAKLPRLKKFCGFIELRGGTMLLGSVGWLAHTALNIMYILSLRAAKRVQEKNKELNIPDEETDPYTEADDLIYFATIMIGLIGSVILFIGARKRKPVLLKIFIILGLLCVVFFISDVIFKLIVSPTKALRSGIYLVIYLYAVLCANSYLQEILDEQDEVQAVAPENESFKPV